MDGREIHDQWIAMHFTPPGRWITVFLCPILTENHRFWSLDLRYLVNMNATSLAELTTTDLVAFRNHLEKNVIPELRDDLRMGKLGGAEEINLRKLD